MAKNGIVCRTGSRRGIVIAVLTVLMATTAAVAAAQKAPKQGAASAAAAAAAGLSSLLCQRGGGAIIAGRGAAFVGGDAIATDNDSRSSLLRRNTCTRIRSRSGKEFVPNTAATSTWFNTNERRITITLMEAFRKYSGSSNRMRRSRSNSAACGGDPKTITMPSSSSSFRQSHPPMPTPTALPATRQSSYSLSSSAHHIIGLPARVRVPVSAQSPFSFLENARFCGSSNNSNNKESGTRLFSSSEAAETMPAFQRNLSKEPVAENNNNDFQSSSHRVY